jgi:hypothetical protein
MKKQSVISCFILFCAFSPLLAFAGGLETNFGEVVVENLPVGIPYSMEKEGRMPLVVNNTSTGEVDLKIEVIVPQQADLKPGYEPIPDSEWISLAENEFRMDPGKSAKTDIIITVPNEEKYAGRKYQVYLWSHTVGRSIGVGLKSRLLFTVAGRVEKEK